MKADNAIAGSLNHPAGGDDGEEPKVRVVEKAGGLILKPPQQQFDAHGPVGNIGERDKKASSGRENVPRLAESIFRVEKVLKHVAEGDQIELLPDVPDPVA